MGRRAGNASIWLLVLAISIFIAAQPARAATPVTTCGMTVSGAGELICDLDCSTYAGTALTLNGTLKLNGHTLTGTDASADSITVDCRGKTACIIRGPGAIVGGGVGIVGTYLKMTDVHVSGAGTGVNAARARLRSCTVAGNGQMVPANDGPGSLQGGGIAIGYRLTMKDSTVTGNGFYGVLHHGQLESSVDIKRSTITGNGNVSTYCSDHLVSCGDIVTRFELRRVKTRATTCGTSRVGNDGTTLGLCSGD